MKIRSFWYMVFVVFLPAESFSAEKAKEVNGTLGKSVTFHLETSQKFTLISWLQVTRDSVNIAILETGQSCSVTVLRSKFEKRLNASRDCRSLQITDLQQDDSGNYRAQIKDYTEDFSLKVYKDLSEIKLKVQCENYTLGDGNDTVLNCSAGKWEDGVHYSWTSTSKGRKNSSHVVHSHFQDDDTNYTCTAENPVSNTSVTVSVKEVCKGNNSPNQYSEKLIPVWIILAIVVIAAVGTGCVLWKKKQKKAAPDRPQDSTGCTVPDESNKTIYAQIDCLPSETQQTGMKKTQPQKKPKSQEGLYTVYASVVQPKLTDDDPSIKTVYDTVNAPRCPEGSEFHKLL